MKLTGSEYEAIVEASPNMIWRAGLDASNYFNVTWLKFTGKTMEQEVGAGWLEGVHPEDKGCCMDTYLASFERRELKWNTGSSGTTDYGVGSTTAACRRSTRSTGSPATLAAAWTLPRRLRAKADRSGTTIRSPACSTETIWRF